MGPEAQVGRARSQETRQARVIVRAGDDTGWDLIPVTGGEGCWFRLFQCWSVTGGFHLAVWLRERQAVTKRRFLVWGTRERTVQPAQSAGAERTPRGALSWLRWSFWCEHSRQISRLYTGITLYHYRSFWSSCPSSFPLYYRAFMLTEIEMIRSTGPGLDTV